MSPAISSLASPLLTPTRLVWMLLLGAAIGVGVLIPAVRDLKLQLQVIAALGIAGLAALLVLPNRRLLLVCAWVLVHPLSLEKVFPVFGADFHNLLPPSLVISGSDLVLYTLLAVMTFEAAFTDIRVFHWPKAMTPFALLAGWAGVLFITGGAPTNSGTLAMMHWVKMLVFLFVFSAAIRDRDEFMLVLVMVAVAVLLQSLILGASYVFDRKFGFSSKVTAAPMMGFTGGDGNVFTRATGTVGHVNQQAMYHTFFTIPLAGLIMVRNWIWRSFFAVVLLGSFCAVLLTFSRASWLSCAFAAGVILFLAWRHRRITPLGWLGIGALALVALLVAGAFSGLILKRLTKGDDGATSSRLRAAQVALGHVTHKPLGGVGPGHFANGQLERTSPDWGYGQWLPRGREEISRDAGGLELQQVEVLGRWYLAPGLVHNKFLMIASELGLVGLGLFLWFQWRVLRHALDGLRTPQPQLWWCAAALVGVFWASQTEYMLEHFYDDKAMVAPLFVIALMISLDRIVASEHAQEGTA